MPEATETGATIEDVASSVTNLTQAVEGMKEGLVDRATVEQIVKEAMEASSHAGYTPEPVLLNSAGEPLDVEREVLGGTPAERIGAILALPARQTAGVLRREVAAVEHFKEAADSLVLLSAVLMGQGRVKSPLDTKFYTREFMPAMRAALDTQTAEEGAEFVPRELSAQLIERVNLQLKVLSVFPEIGMPTDPFDLPARGLKRVRGGRHLEQTADTGQTKAKKITPGTRKVTLEAAKFMTEILTAKEAEEDAIVAVLPLLQEELEEFTAADLEDASINGDTDAEHRDGDSDEADDPRKNWDGIRKIADLVNSERDQEGKDLSVAGLRANRKLMGKYGIDPNQLVHIVGMVSYIDLLSDEKVQTVDKYGANATVLTGELGRADGVPLIVSEYVREDLNATGKYDGETKTRSIAATVHRRAFLRGTRRRLMVEFLRELYSESDQDAVKISTRQALTRRWGSDKAVAVTYNVDAT